MEIDFAFICDHAESTGKVSALGIGFDTIYAESLPARHSHMTVVCKFRGSIAEVGQKQITLKIIDADGNEVMRAETPMELKRPPTGLYTIAVLVVNIDGLEFSNYGDYSVHILFEGNEMHRIGLTVAPLPVTS